jgi:hypothetical protein
MATQFVSDLIISPGRDGRIGEDRKAVTDRQTDMVNVFRISKSR